MSDFIPSSVPLGKQTQYTDQYAPQLLVAIARAPQRELLGLTEVLPFVGGDLWQIYELSWLNDKGKPEVALARVAVSCDSPAMIESKSLKLYLNSFNQTRLSSAAALAQCLERDLSACAGSLVQVELSAPDQGRAFQAYWQQSTTKVECIDCLDVEVEQYQVDSSLLKRRSTSENVEEVLVSHLLRSCCPVTGQPDWGSLFVHYRGPAIDRASLLRYIISFRTNQAFHEQCVEHIFCDLYALLKPQYLAVAARYLRRGGIDINPYRLSESGLPPVFPELRQ